MVSQTQAIVIGLALSVVALVLGPIVLAAHGEPPPGLDGFKALAVSLLLTVSWGGVWWLVHRDRSSAVVGRSLPRRAMLLGSASITAALLLFLLSRAHELVSSLLCVAVTLGCFADMYHERQAALRSAISRGFSVAILCGLSFFISRETMELTPIGLAISLGALSAALQLQLSAPPGGLTLRMGRAAHVLQLFALALLPLLALNGLAPGSYAALLLLTPLAKPGLAGPSGHRQLPLRLVFLITLFCVVSVAVPFAARWLLGSH